MKVNIDGVHGWVAIIVLVVALYLAYHLGQSGTTIGG